MDNYKVKKIEKKENIIVSVPGSKSITNRALLLAALSNGESRLKGVLFSDDSRAMLNCLEKLGFELSISEANKEVTIIGCGGDIPNKNATIDVRSAGTAARFLTVFLAVSGGDYVLKSSEQMQRRPMQEIIDALRQKGVVINCLKEEGHFPFEIHSKGLKNERFKIDTSKSTQYASALLIASVISGMELELMGSRVNGAYINITLRIMKQFGINYDRTENVFKIRKHEVSGIEYQIEPDASSACYFYAMALLLRTKSKVKNVHLDSMQGDIKFLNVLEQLGCKLTDEKDGILLDATRVDSYNGVEIDMSDFSDQTLTMAAVAAFAENKTKIQNIEHIRLQESDRAQVIVNELQKIGAEATIVEKEGRQSIEITPVTKSCLEEEVYIKTYDDHRVAMSFSLVGLVLGNVYIQDYRCCRKTFENYFDILDELFE